LISFEPLIHLFEPLIHLFEPLIHLFEPLIHLFEPLFHQFKMSFHFLTKMNLTFFQADGTFPQLYFKRKSQLTGLQIRQPERQVFFNIHADTFKIFLCKCISH